MSLVALPVTDAPEGHRVCGVTSESGGLTTSVLRVEGVRWAIDVLTSLQVHSFFIAYLFIRSTGIEAGDLSQIRPTWADLGNLLEVPGGPPGKPYYRPLMDGPVHDRSRYWMNRNLQGSWAPSSLRQGQEPLEVVNIAGRGFALGPRHAGRALEHLLHGVKMPILALAAYLYRDYGFMSEGLAPSLSLIETFISDFHFHDIGGISKDFEILFTTDSPSHMPRLLEIYSGATDGGVS